MTLEEVQAVINAFLEELRACAITTGAENVKHFNNARQLWLQFPPELQMWVIDRIDNIYVLKILLGLGTRGKAWIALIAKINQLQGKG
jgi:hypothetical protein